MIPKYKIASIIVTFLVMCIEAYSQEEKYAFGIFRSVALNEYASTSFGNDAGYAENGWGIFVEYKSKIHHWPEGFYLGIHLSVHQNTMDEEAYKNDIETAFNDQFDMPLTVKLSATRYRPLIATIGPFYDLKINKWLSIGAKSGLGLMYLGLKPMRIKLYDDQNEELLNEKIEFSGKLGLTYLIGLNMNMALREDLDISLFADHSAGTSELSTIYANYGEFESDFLINFVNIGFSFSIFI